MKKLLRAAGIGVIAAGLQASPAMADDKTLFNPNTLFSQGTFFNASFLHHTAVYQFRTLQDEIRAQILPSLFNRGSNLEFNSSEPFAPSQTAFDAAGAGAGLDALEGGGPLSGLAAGSGMQREGIAASSGGTILSVWTSFTYSWFEDDFAVTKMDGNSSAVYFGADLLIAQKHVVGLAVGLDWTNVDTPTNGGGSDSFGVTISPYYVYIINQNWDVDASASFTFQGHDNHRIAVATLVTGDSSTNTYTGSININGNWWLDKFNLGASAGYLFSQSESAGYTESNGTAIPSNDTTLAQIAGTLKLTSYHFDWIYPYVSVRPEYDLVHSRRVVGAGQATPPDDRFGLNLGVGAQIRISEDITGGVSYSHGFLRQDLSNQSITANLRFTWD